jgi:F-type H+-transporting ATPase subunit b
VETIAQTFGVDWPHLAAQTVSFSIVCALLHKFAYQPVLRMLEERRRQIAQGLANSEKINAALAAIAAQRNQTIAEARAEATRLVADARQASKRLSDQAMTRAATSAEQLMDKAREAIARERARMMDELRGEVGRLVVATTAAVTGRILTDDDQRRLAEETARQLAGNRAA